MGLNERNMNELETSLAQHLDDVDRNMANELQTFPVNQHMHRDPYALTSSSEVESSDLEIVHDHDYAMRLPSRCTESDNSSESVVVGENDKQTRIQAPISSWMKRELMTVPCPKGVQEALCPNCGRLSSTLGQCFFCDSSKGMKTTCDQTCGNGPPYKEDSRSPSSSVTMQSVILPKGSVPLRKTNPTSAGVNSRDIQVTIKNKLRSPTISRKRARSSHSKKAEPVVISIDSDSDDQGESRDRTSSVEEKRDTPSTEYGLIPAVSEQVSDKQNVSRKYRMRDESGNITEVTHPSFIEQTQRNANNINVCVAPSDHSVILSAIMLRFGSLGIVGPSSVEFRNDRFLFHLPATYPVTYVHFDTKSLESCQYFLSRGMPTIMLDTTFHFARVMRERLRMVKGEAFFDPSSDVEAEKRIIFRPRQDPLPRSVVQCFEDIFHSIASTRGCYVEEVFIKLTKSNIGTLLGRCRPPKENLDKEYLNRISSQQLSSKQRKVVQATHQKESAGLASEDVACDDGVTSSSRVSPSSAASGVKADQLQAESLSEACPSNSSNNNQITSTDLSQPQLILVYPPPPSKGGVVVHKVDLECLDEGEFLNDVIIDFYIKYLVSEVLSEEDRQKTYVFSSFFYGRLMRREYSRDQSPGDIPSTRMERRHQKVRKWTRNVDIFEKDFIIVPINEHCHWYVAIICYPGLVGASENMQHLDINEKGTCNSATTLECTDNGKCTNDTEELDESEVNFSKRTKLAEERAGPSGNVMHSVVSAQHSIQSTQLIHDTQDCQTEQTFLKTQGTALAHNCRFRIKRPCILVFDSLGGPSRRNVIQNLREYLTVERQTRKKSEHVYDSHTMKGFQPRVPQQNNFSDCGVFLLQYVQMFFEKPIMNFTIPIRGLETWFADAEVKRKRSEIRDLIHELKRRHEANQR